jgi:hypothetical protein
VQLFSPAEAHCSTLVIQNIFCPLHLFTNKYHNEKKRQVNYPAIAYLPALGAAEFPAHIRNR